LENVRRRLANWRGWAGIACVALLLAPGLTEAAYRIVVPRQRHEIRPVIAFVEQHREADDQLLVLCPAEFEFYTGRDTRHAASEPNPAARTWFIATRPVGGAFPNQDLLDRLAACRVRLLAVEAYGAAAYLFAAEGAPAIVQ